MALTENDDGDDEEDVFFHVPKHDSVLSLVIFQPPSEASNLGKRVIS